MACGIVLSQHASAALSTEVGENVTRVVVGASGCVGTLQADANLSGNSVSGTIDLTGFCTNASTLDLRAVVGMPTGTPFSENQALLSLARGLAAQDQAQAIPTLSEYGLVLLAALIAAL